MNSNKRQRNSNLELLRIIAMVFIVSHHFAVHGFEDFNFVIANSNNYLIYFLGLFGKIGVDIFVLISAYFMVTSKFTLKKLLVLVGGIYFYALAALSAVVLFIPAIHLTPGLILRAIFPLSHGYWFMSCYIVLMILSPFLNRFINSLSKNTFLKLILFMVVIWSLYPTFTGASLMYGDSFGYGFMAGFILLYFIGAFIRLHLDISKFNFKKLIVLLIASIVLLYLGSVILTQLGILFNIESLTDGKRTVKVAYEFFTRENKLFILATSVIIFLIFLKRKEFSNKYINYIAGSALGVYLIHDNTLVRPYLWDHLIVVSSYYNSPNLWILAIISIVSVYIVCTGIDIVRRETVEKLWIKFVDTKLIDIANRIYIKGLNSCTKMFYSLLR